MTDRAMRIAMMVIAAATTITAVVALVAAFYAVRAVNALEDVVDQFSSGFEDTFADPFASESSVPIADLATVREVTGIGDEVDDATLQEAADAACLGTYSDPAEMSDATGLRSDQARFLMGEGAFEFCGA